MISTIIYAWRKCHNDIIVRAGLRHRPIGLRHKPNIFRGFTLSKVLKNCLVHYWEICSETGNVMWCVSYDCWGRFNQDGLNPVLIIVTDEGTVNVSTLCTKLNIVLQLYFLLALWTADIDYCHSNLQHMCLMNYCVFTVTVLLHEPNSGCIKHWNLHETSDNFHQSDWDTTVIMTS